MNNDQNQYENKTPDGGFSTFEPVPPPPGMHGAPETLKHSGLGIASFIIALLAILAAIITLVLTVSFTAEFINMGTLDPESLEAQILDGDSAIVSIMAAGLLFIVSIGLSVIGLILGIVGAVMKNRKKVFSVLGIVLNALIAVGVVVLVIISMVAGAAGAV
ncbi:hypothetical protein [Paenibacillus chungangensis]|uniref:DUF4064 domain-containing protein n=1 Tax=Paenibacillus chungangensis TaxID=696535 RepID=A0ABW3HL79_9BACL